MRVAPLLLLLACKKDQPQPASAPSTGEGLFAEGCPTPGQATARRVGVDATLPGKVAVGTRGDFLLMNGSAAYVITEPDKGSTYYYYGGILADAAPVSGCVAGDDKLDEVGLVLGALDLTAFNQSVLRGFKGESAEVLADGSDGGAAIVRVTGTDAPYWLVEYTLINDALNDGGRALSGSFHTELVVDYILEPDSPVLEIQMTVRNAGEDNLSLLAASLISVGETFSLFGYASAQLSYGGFNLDYGMPWLVATDGAGALAYGVQDGNLATMNISGVDVAVDVQQALSNPIALRPGEEDQRSTFLSVGPTDGPSATAPLGERNSSALPGGSFSLEMVSGVVEGPDGPVAGAAVTLQAHSEDADWGALDRAYTDEDGRYTLYTPVFSEPWSWRVVASAEGRDDGEPVAVSPGDEGVSVTVGAAGSIDYQFEDEAGDPSPARLYLAREDGAVEHRWLKDAGSTPVPPGTYDYTLTRGYEYEPVSGTITVPEGGAASLVATLARLVDTTGFLSVDTHVHSSDSSDSDIATEGQLSHAAAHGLEVVVHTEHENIVDHAGLPVEAGLDAWVNNVEGEEVTATVPEHLTMFPVELDGQPRGGFIQWYQKDLDQLFTEMYDRSNGGINLLNHPSYLDRIGWDRLTASPTLDDPTLLGLASDAALWSWQLDGIEVMNGHGSPFMDDNHRFDNWMSMVNAGHPLVAVGCSDDHGGNEVGFPRTYFASSTDDPASFDLDDLVDSFRAGATVASAGAFARVRVNDAAGLGELITDPDGEVSLSVEVEAIPEIDVTHVIVFANCDEVASLAADEPYGVLKLSEVLDVPVSGDTSLVIAAFGADYLPKGLPQYNPAHTPRVLTSPIYIDGDGDGVWSAPGGRECSYSLEAP